LSDFDILCYVTEEHLRLAVYDSGPVACAIDAFHYSFHLYQSGVYDEPGCSSDFQALDHAVLTIGWGNDEGSGKDYWIVQNSLGI
jgi:hypothetical protein